MLKALGSFNNEKNLSIINGEFKDSISVYDRGLAYGDGFFETMLWDSFEKKETNFGVEFWLRHLKRIKDGCRLIQINFPSDDEIVRQRNIILKASLKEKNQDYWRWLLREV